MFMNRNSGGVTAIIIFFFSLYLFIYFYSITDIIEIVARKYNYFKRKHTEVKIRIY